MLSIKGRRKKNHMKSIICNYPNMILQKKKTIGLCFLKSDYFKKINTGRETPAGGGDQIICPENDYLLDFFPFGFCCCLDLAEMIGVLNTSFDMSS